MSIHSQINLVFFSPAIYNSQSVLVQADLHCYDYEAVFLDCCSLSRLLLSYRSTILLVLLQWWWHDTKHFMKIPLESGLYWSYLFLCVGVGFCCVTMIISLGQWNCCNQSCHLWLIVLVHDLFIWVKSSDFCPEKLLNWPSQSLKRTHNLDQICYCYAAVAAPQCLTCTQFLKLNY